MKNRKAILFLLCIFTLLAYSRISAADATGLPAARYIDGGKLANIPPVNHAITVFQAKLKKDPSDAVSYSMLGELYMRQARETGDATGYQRAEASLDEALKLLPGYAPAGASLASAYYAQHDFEHALDLAHRELLEARAPEGHWLGKLSSSALSTATAVCALSVMRANSERSEAASESR